MKSLPIAAAVALSLLVSIPARAVLPAQPITVEVVNDSGLPDDQVFVLLSGQPDNGLVASIPVANSSSGFDNDPPVAAQAVSSLTNTGNTIVSTSSGRTLPIYSFTVTSIKSGLLYVMYGAPGTPPASPFSYSTAAPSPITTAFRFSQLELTYDANLVSVADLTNIDYFSIPMKLEGYSNSVLGTLSTIYDSTPALIAQFQELGFSTALRSTTNPDPSSGNPWDPATDPTFSTFARVLAPGQYAATSPTGDPAPYPSFVDYLDSLAAANYTWTDVGLQNGSTFAYNGAIASDGAGGYTITLSPQSGGQPNPVPPSPLPAGATITVHLPSGTAAGATTANNFNTYIYGCVLNHLSFSLAPTGGMSDSQFDTNAPNSVYGAIVSDALAGLNFGYLNGRWGTAVEGWFANLPTAAPFGAARSPNDGYYNPWAALIYNNSDSYGFAFSDRSGPSPAVPLDNTGAGMLRLTILPDSRLDAPRPTVTAVTENSITVEWPAVENATDYTVQVVPPYPATNDTVTADGSESYSKTINGLNASTPYSITVIANGTANSNPIQSAYVPIQASTGVGTFVSTSGSIPFNVGFNLNGANGTIVTINGTDHTLSNNSITPFGLTGAPGMNSYAVVVSSVLPGQVGGAQSVVFEGNIFIQLTGDASSYTVGPLPTPVPLGYSPYLVGNLGAFITDNNAAGGNNLTVVGNNPAPYTPANAMTLGVPFTPYALKVLSGIVPPTPFVAEPSSNAGVIAQSHRDLRIINKDIKKAKKTLKGADRRETLKQLKFAKKVVLRALHDSSNSALASLQAQVMKAVKIKNDKKRAKKFKQLQKKFKKIA